MNGTRLERHHTLRAHSSKNCGGPISLVLVVTCADLLLSHISSVIPLSNTTVYGYDELLYVEMARFSSHSKICHQYY